MIKILSPLRSIITYYLLTIFGVFLIRPALPVVDYFINFDYIAEVLCLKKQVPESSCNGKCYLMQQMEENKHDDPQKNFPQTQWEIQLLSIHQPISYDLFFEEVDTTLVFSPFVISLKTPHFSINTPPPEQKSSSLLA
tara:strand:+ start:552 stop:965 length:414 start_codon:yes stop_codon:yes gene_type:complete